MRRSGSKRNADVFHGNGKHATAVTEHAIIARMADKQDRKSQRTNGFHGGIQDGTVAFGKDAQRLDHMPLEYIRVRRYGASKHWRKGFSAQDIVDYWLKNYGVKIQGGKIVGFSPDGGCFLDKDGNILLAVECKKQGKGGNAIERWYKNDFSLTDIVPCKCYLTLCYGDGFFDDAWPESILKTSAIKERNGDLSEFWTSDANAYPHVFRRFNDPATLRQGVFDAMDMCLKQVGWQK